MRRFAIHRPRQKSSKPLVFMNKREPKPVLCVILSLPMKRAIFLLTCFGISCGFAFGTVTVDEEAFGKSLGGWRKKGNKTAEYSLSGSIYRTYRPETSKTPEGGIFVSIRIDHVRGWLSSNDHAILEITIGPKGTIDSAKSNIAIQGKSITSDVIVGVSQAGQAVTDVDQAVQVGTDLVADLTAKLLRENIVEAGRVSFPAALRHNYNLIYQALLLNGIPMSAPSATGQPEGDKLPAGENSTSVTTTGEALPGPAEKTETEPASTTEAAKPTSEPTPPAAKPIPENKPLDVAPYTPPPVDLQTSGDLSVPPPAAEPAPPPPPAAGS